MNWNLLRMAKDNSSRNAHINSRSEPELLKRAKAELDAAIDALLESDRKAAN